MNYIQRIYDLLVEAEKKGSDPDKKKREQEMADALDAKHTPDVAAKMKKGMGLPKKKKYG